MNEQIQTLIRAAYDAVVVFEEMEKPKSSVDDFDWTEEAFALRKAIRELKEKLTDEGNAK